MATVNRTSSFDLAIENQYRDQATPVLYIVSFPREDDDTQHVRFRFTNGSGKDYVLKALTTADAGNFHFALVFRPSTLHYNNPGEIQTKFQAAIGDGWMVSAPITQEDSTEAIYFSAKAGKTVKANEGITFLVKELSGAAATGSRSTQVQLLFREPVGDQFVTRVRNQHMDIVNHDGKTFAPLDFVILGDPTLVHRSQDNMLRIQVVETNGRPITVGEKTSIDFKFPYYKGDYDPNYHPAWVFGKSDNVGTISCRKNENEKTEIKTDTVGNDIVFHIPNLEESKVSGDPTSFEWGYKNIRIKFESGESISNQLLKFLNIPADGPIGDARIKITVSNLPGYWDTEFELRVHKTLLSTGYYPPLERSYGMLNNQVVVGKSLPEGWQMDGALHSSLSVTSADINDKNGKSEVTELLRLHDGKIPMNGLGISVGNWQEVQNPNDPPIANDPHLKDGFLIKADQYNHGTRFKVDFFGNITADGDISVEGRVRDATGLVMPVGAIIAYGGSTAPDGWLLCDGQTSLIDSKYEELKKAINLNTTPDLRSRFVVGAGDGDGLSNYPIGLGKNEGTEKQTLTAQEMPAHNHTVYAYVQFPRVTAHADWLHTDIMVTGDTWATADSLGKKHTTIVASSGGGLAHNNLPPYYALTYIIKY